MKKRVCSLVALLAIVIMGFVRGIVKGNGMIRKRRTWQLKKKKRYMKRIICLLLVTFAVFTGFSVETLAYYAVTADDAVNWVLGHTEGKGYDYDGVYGAQCVDLIKGYMDYIGGTHTTGNAKDYNSNWLPDGYQRIQKYNGFVPEKGDILIWTTGQYGHVAICTAVNSNWEIVFSDQNGANSSLKVKHSRKMNPQNNDYWGVIRPDFKPSEYYLDINGCINGEINGNMKDFGTCDVYINGVLVANDVDDYYATHPIGTTYLVTDIKVKQGKSYVGLHSGSRSGTINGTTKVCLSFNTIPSTTGVQPVIKTFGGHTYYYVNRKSTWYEAKYFSEKMGGHLVTITSAAENNFLSSFVGDQTVWIGLTDEASEGTWKWVNGEGFSYSNWCSGEPNNSSNESDQSENYAGLWAGGTWNDYPGYPLYPFICEFDKAFTVKYDANGGQNCPADQVKGVGQNITISSAIPTRPCHTFVGWSTNKSAARVDYVPGASYSNDADITLYAVWSEGVTTDWTTVKPSGIADSQIETKTQYRYADKQTTTSTSPSMSGYERVGSKWNKTGSGTIDYVANWPSGFDKANSYYNQYNKAIKSNSESETKKVTVSSPARIGYIYWHWCLHSYEYGPVNRVISDCRESKYPHFDAFYTTQDASHYDPNGVNGKDTFYY